MTVSGDARAALRELAEAIVDSEGGWCVPTALLWWRNGAVPDRIQAAEYQTSEFYRRDLRLYRALVAADAALAEEVGS